MHSSHGSQRPLRPARDHRAPEVRCRGHRGDIRSAPQHVRCTARIFSVPAGRAASLDPQLAAGALLTRQTHLKQPLMELRAGAVRIDRDGQ